MIRMRRHVFSLGIEFALKLTSNVNITPTTVVDNSGKIGHAQFDRNK